MTRARILVPAGLLLALAGVAVLGLRHQARETETMAVDDARLHAADDQARRLADLGPMCAAYRDWSRRAADRVPGMERLCAEADAAQRAAAQTPLR